MKKTKIENKLYDVVTVEEYISHPNLYDPQFTAIEIYGSILPIRSSVDTSVGYYPQGNMVSRVIKPADDQQQYSSSSVIDFDDVNSIKDIINKNNLVKDYEHDILTTKDDITVFNISSDDTPEMVGLKKAINSKQIDIDKYKQRFDQYQNDIRILKGNTITLQKLINTCNSLDIEATLTLKDKEGAVNPMDTVITMNLTNRGGE